MFVSGLQKQCVHTSIRVFPAASTAVQNQMNCCRPRSIKGRENDNTGEDPISVCIGLGTYKVWSLLMQDLTGADLAHA